LNSSPHQIGCRVKTEQVVAKDLVLEGLAGLIANDVDLLLA